MIITLKSEELIEDGEYKGMLIEFGDVKEKLKKETEKLDHSLIIEENSLSERTLNALKEENFNIITVNFRPTAENFAKYFYKKMKKYNYTIATAEVYETPNNKAIYGE